MPRLESAKRLLFRWFTSLIFFALLGLALGVAIAVPTIPPPKIGIISLSAPYLNQSYADETLETLRKAREDNSIKAVVLQINSPGGSASATEQIYLEVLRLRAKKPVVASIGLMGASGGYYLAVAANYIYALPTSLVGSIGVWASLPNPEKPDEDTLTSGPFKATGGSQRRAVAELEMVRQEFVTAVTSQRGDRLKLSAEELSMATLYLGVEALKNGLIDDIGTVITAREKAAALAGVRHYEVTEMSISGGLSYFFFGPSELKELRAQTGLTPAYYYLYFESE